uniref:Uncharacterized protein n=1 Tax=Romanomermis culicivorax TaxID=13658 RepID=A0A915KAS6_ROMCU
MAASTSTTVVANHQGERYNHVTPYQLYISMHEMLVSSANNSSSFSLEQIFDHVAANDHSLSNVERKAVENEMRKVLLVGVTAGWCRFSKKGGFAPTSSPPDKVELDSEKSKVMSNLNKQTIDGVPRNVIVHGSISDPAKVPGFVVEVDDFIAFMERIGVWPKGLCSGGNVSGSTD